MNRKICIVTTMFSSINNWIKPFFNVYHENGFDVTVVANMSEDFIKNLSNEFPYITAVNLPFPRGINVKASLQSINQLAKLFKKEKFDLVQYSTPNASFYAAIAAKSTKVPIRIYAQWGMVFVTMKGIKRFIFKNIEKLNCKNATVIQPDSSGNLDLCRKLGFYDKSNSYIIWNGSAKGIDLELFDFSKKELFKQEIFKRYGIDNNCTVIGFVGRLGREKGCNELFEAFWELKKENENLKLLFVGPIEKEETIEPSILERFKQDNDIIKTDRVADVNKHVAAMDIFILPSYREGFGMSVVEAEAMGVPVIVTNIPGPTSGMLENKTGLIIPVNDKNAIKSSLKDLINNTEKKEQFGKNAVIYARENFDSKIFKQKLIEDRINLLEKYR